MRYFILAILLVLSGEAWAATNWCSYASVKACWKVDVGSGNLADSSSNGINGTLSTPVWASAPTNGKPGYVNYSLNFDGNDKITLADVGLNSSQTFAGWFYYSSTGATNNYFAGNGLDWNFGVTLNTAKHQTCRVDTTPAMYCVTNASSVTTGIWYHLAGTYSGTTIKVFENGVEKNSSSGGVSGLRNASASIIGSDGSGNYLNGYMAESALFSSALTSTDISEMMTYGLAGTYNPITTGPSILRNSIIRNSIIGRR